MKKTVAISLLVCSFLFANDEYNVFVGSFSETSKKKLSKALELAWNAKSVTLKT